MDKAFSIFINGKILYLSMSLNNYPKFIVLRCKGHWFCLPWPVVYWFAHTAAPPSVLNMSTDVLAATLSTDYKPPFWITSILWLGYRLEEPDRDTDGYTLMPEQLPEQYFNFPFCLVWFHFYKRNEWIFRPVLSAFPCVWATDSRASWHRLAVVYGPD